MEKPVYSVSPPPESNGAGLNKTHTFFKRLIQQKTLAFMCIPFVIWAFVFKYLPLWGWTMAFQNFKPARSFSEQEWAGLKHFRILFEDSTFYRVLRNTLVMSTIQLVLGFVTAITLALLLNELKNIIFKRVVQTVSYLPHFISWVVASSIVLTVLSPDGIINLLLTKLHLLDKPVLWMGKGEYFWGILGATQVWKDVGWNTIIYLAAITAIDPSQYEAAEIDGANRFQRMMSITLPGLKPVIIILLIMNLGNILESGFEPQYLLGNGMNLDYSENLDIFVLKYGLGMGNFSLGTAAGIFKTVVSFIFLFSANHIAKRMGESRLF
ncbi:protein lplB [Paenibacillus sp. FSL R7-0273]|uniref:ABC transporter permease n=1 Tax=Paenibacillus sp. FSL R7-0273 TaxID=1536772 RepID=UPI0004F80E20|nr:ABC transporter permease subunit [Paenibacillus sp. FSL R7-0273]AIQ47398.1 protein lplB [Paenibacillus sp. FSL R7-0273]OMF96048.1 protein lplB [Paenibacillus sp. FSL R7-0273]